MLKERCSGKREIRVKVTYLIRIIEKGCHQCLMHAQKPNEGIQMTELSVCRSMNLVE